jgi:hypothetical protein
MKHAWLVPILLLLLPMALSAQSAVPAGTVIPLSLDTGLKSGKIKSGKVVRAEVMQDIPRTTIRRRAQLLGHVVSVTPTRLELRFGTLVTKHENIPLTTSLRAMASMMEVEFAQIPGGGADRGLPPDERTTTQIGGEQDYRGGGPVARGTTIVGEPTPFGVLGKLSSKPPCPADSAENDQAQALWLFSTDACGLFGFNHLAIQHSGRTNPVGTIVLIFKSGKLNIRSGSGLLLRVEGP